MKMDKKDIWVRYLMGVSSALSTACGLTNMYGSEAYRGTYSKKAVESLRPFLPYCLHPVGDGADFIWLNREYKPLHVMPYEEWVDYKEFPWLHVRKDDPRIAELLTQCNWVCDLYFLFDDGNPPWAGKKEAIRLLGMIEDTLFECDQEK